MVKTAALPEAIIEAAWDLGGLVSEYWHVCQHTVGSTAA